MLTFRLPRPGATRTSRADHEYSIGEQADLTEALWRRLGIEETGVVGHDSGATVAQELLARAEEGRSTPG